MTRDEAVKAIDANWPTANYTMLREALTLAKDALRSRPAPPDDLALRYAWEAGFRLCRSYGDNHHHFDGEQKERKWRDYIEGLAAPAPVAAPAPIGESPLAHAAVEATARAHGWDAESDTLAGWLHTRLSVAAPAPETPAPVDVPACPDGQHSYRRNAPPQNGDVCFVCRKSIWWETPAPDAMPAPNWIECPNCGGMGTTFHDILVGGTEHDTEERCCEVCKGTGKRRQEAQP